MIEVLNNNHVHAVTQLHLSSLSGLLRDLGPAATDAFYRGAVRSSSAIGFVHMQGGRLVGFVLGAANPRKMRREILTNSFFRSLAGMCAGFIRKPVTFRSLMTSLLADNNDFDSTTAELTYLAVDPNQRSSGIGKQLVEHFSQTLSELNVTAYELSVDAANQAAIGFYQQLGFVEVNSYSEFGIERKRYRKVLALEHA